VIWLPAGAQDTQLHTKRDQEGCGSGSGSGSGSSCSCSRRWCAWLRLAGLPVLEIACNNSLDGSSRNRFSEARLADRMMLCFVESVFHSTLYKTVVVCSSFRCRWLLNTITFTYQSLQQCRAGRSPLIMVAISSSLSMYTMLLPSRGRQTPLLHTTAVYLASQAAYAFVDTALLGESCGASSRILW
jgi:hypothetical protein